MEVQVVCQIIFVVVSLLVPTFCVTSTHPSQVCTPGMRYCGSEISKKPSHIYICNRKGNDWTNSSCQGRECVVLPETKSFNPICLDKCTPGFLYCGRQLTKMGYGEVMEFKPNSLYKCEDSSNLTLIQSCLGSCVPDSEKTRCKQACEPGLNYCGRELNNLEDWPKTHLPNSIYHCNRKRTVDLITNCIGKCESSDKNSFCTAKTYIDICELSQSPSRVKRVQDGTEAKQGRWPWMASLMSNGHHFCGGALIGAQWILTAAHCVIDKTRFDVVLGNRSPRRYSKGESRHRVGRENIFIHKNYNVKPHANDIALIRLERPATFTTQIQPHCLSEVPVTKAQDCMVAGWGQTKPGFSASVLQEGKVSILTSEECQQLYAQTRVLANYIFKLYFNKSISICAGQRTVDYTDTCSGDSGGPLMCQNDRGKWVVVGLTSWGPGHSCTDAAKVFLLPGFYTRVSAYLPWIEDVTGMTMKLRNFSSEDSHVPYVSYLDENSESKGSSALSCFSSILLSILVMSVM